MFDNRLEQLRIDMGLNKKDAAVALGMAYTTYLGYEKNEREPNSEVLIKIAKFFDVDIDYLLGISPCKKKENYVLVTELGLTEDSVDVIKSLNIEGLSNALNYLIANNHFKTLLSWLSQYKNEFADKNSADKAFKEFCDNRSKYMLDIYAVQNLKDYEYLIFNNLMRSFEYLVDRLPITE